MDWLNESRKFFCVITNKYAPQMAAACEQAIRDREEILRLRARVDELEKMKLVSANHNADVRRLHDELAKARAEKTPMGQLVSHLRRPQDKEWHQDCPSCGETVRYVRQDGTPAWFACGTSEDIHGLMLESPRCALNQTDKKLAEARKRIELMQAAANKHMVRIAELGVRPSVQYLGDMGWDLIFLRELKRGQIEGETNSALAHAIAFFEAAQDSAMGAETGQNTQPSGTEVAPPRRDELKCLNCGGKLAASSYNSSTGPAWRRLYCEECSRTGAAETASSGA